MFMYRKNCILGGILYILFSSLLALGNEQNASDDGVSAINGDLPILKSPWNKSMWKARWCVSPRERQDIKTMDVSFFRKSFNLDKKPDTFIINLTADIKANLYVNGILVLRFPIKGDIFNWSFDTVDIAKFLKSGKNTLAVQVMNYGEDKPYSYMSNWTRARLLVQGQGEAEKDVNTPEGWKVRRSYAFSPITIPHIPYMGKLERMDASKFEFGWQNEDFDDSSWDNPDIFNRASAYGCDRTGEVFYGLEQRDIPFMEEKSIYNLKVRKSENISVDDTFLKRGGKAIKIPSNTKCSILLDGEVLTNAYLSFVASGGKGAKMTVKYAENLCPVDLLKTFRQNRGNRNDIEKKDFHPNATIRNEFIFDGGPARRFITNDWRTYRYIGLDIQTGKDPLELSDFHGIFTGYPFKENASFESSDKTLNKIWEVAWRTARLCAVDTYMDCPYYERLQYIGDTRIQALISLYISGDSRLMRRALKIMSSSKTPEGLLQSRYPSSAPQIIPPFCLYWINMLRDYQMHVDDMEFVYSQLSTVEGIIAWFENQIDSQTGMLKADMPHWNFLDWSGWATGNAPVGETSGSSTHTLHFAITLRDAAAIMRSFGNSDTAAKYEKLADKITNSVYKNCWNPERKMLSDFKGANKFSQHANIMGILSGAISKEEAPNLMLRIMADKSIAQATYYYRFYLTRALVESGMGDEYLNTINPWKEMLDLGLSTFAERPDPVRSECHAWSASPIYELLATVCGIKSCGEGFLKVSITPRLGNLSYVKAKFPHPKGYIELDIKKSEDGNISGDIKVPAGLSAILFANGKQVELKIGSNEF